MAGGEIKVGDVIAEQISGFVRSIFLRTNDDEIMKSQAPMGNLALLFCHVSRLPEDFILFQAERVFPAF